MLLLHSLLICSVLTIGIVSGGGPTMMPDNAPHKFKYVNSVEGHCSGGKCSGFRFGDPNEVAFFDIKERVRIVDGATYDIINPVAYKTLVFVNSTFAHFPMNLFYTLDIKELDMRECAIEILIWENFLKADNLQILLLSRNQIEEIPYSTFEYAPELQYLFLDENRISRLHGDSFVGLKKLLFLDLSDNQLETLPDGIFEKLELLQELHLSGNHLSALDVELLAYNPKLHTLHFSRNNLSDINEEAFNAQSNLAVFDVSHNPELRELVVNLRVRTLIAANCSLIRINIYGSVSKAVMNDNRILELYFSEPENLEELNLRNNSLEQIASLTMAVNLRVLDLSGNPKLHNLPDPWMTSSLERLNLSNIGLDALPMNVLRSEDHLRSLDVSHNKLTDINPAYFKQLQKLTHFYIHDNDWNCYNLNLIMDLLLYSRSISYIEDQYDPYFPGEYRNGIACMYRIESDEENTNQNLEPETDSIDAESSNVYASQQQQQQQQELDELNDRVKDNDEVNKLRNELRTIVRHYEEKMQRAFDMINDLDERMKQFEQLNATMWNHVTLTV